MPDPLILGTLDDVLDELPGTRTLLSAARRAQLAWLPKAYLLDLVVRHEAPDALVAELMILLADAGVELARLGPVAVGLVAAPEPDRPILLRVRLGAAATPAFELALYDLRLNIEFAQPWLRRVDPATRRPLPEPFRFEVDAMLRVASDGGTDFRLYGLSLPPFAVGNTGLIVALEDCQLAADGHGVPLSLRDLVAGESTFDGVYARHARLTWLPPFRFPFATLPGLNFSFRDVLIDGTGVTFTLDEHWPVVRAPADPHRLLPGSGLYGSFFGDRLRVAIEHATGSVVQNEPVGFALEGWLEFAPLFPLLRARLTAERDPQTNEGAVAITLEQDAGTSIDFNLLGIGSLSLTNLAAEGVIGDEQLRVEGAGRFAATLPGWQSAAIDVFLAFTVGTSIASLNVRLPQLALGPLGDLSDAAFNVVFASDDVGAWQVTEFGIDVTLAWRDLAGRLPLADLPPQIPRPPDTARVTASVRWEAAGGLTLRLEAAVDDASGMFAFVPLRFRPEVRDVAFGIQAHYDNAADFFGTAPGAPLTGEAYAAFSFRPALESDLADGGLVSLRAGNTEGFVTARMFATVGSGGATTLRGEVLDPVKLDINAPGASREPFVTLALTQASLALSSGTSDPTAVASLEITLEGSFAVVPAAALSPPPGLAESLTALLQPLINARLEGAVTAKLRLAGERAALDLACVLDEAALDVDLFDIVRQVSQGRTTPAAVRRARQDMDLELRFGFALRGLLIRIGTLEDSVERETPVSLELRFRTTMAGITVEGFARLAANEFVLGIDDAELPLQLPRFPLAPADLERLSNAGGRWTQARIGAALDDWRRERNGLTGDESPAARERRSQIDATIGLVGFIRSIWGSLGSAAARRSYQDNVTLLVTLMAQVRSVTRSDSRVRLRIASALLRVPFDDPRLIALEGQAVLEGFAADDWLHGLDGMRLKLGLSADQIYFGLEGTGEPILLPAAGKYNGGEISLTQLTLGYGFTRNSFAMSFAGALKLPDGLATDADTSSRIGFGVRIPQHTRLAFRLDMIPIPGPIPVVPVVEFSLDMRSPGLPALRGTDVCRPAWDGLQLHIPGVIRADVKAAAISPLFTIVPVPNLRFDGDLDLGNDEFGVTLISDDLLVLLGIGTIPNLYPVQYLIDPTAPYFDHLCLNVRFAGFGINFNLERPLPIPNPLLVFEVLGLIADPLKPIDPNGALARLVRITLSDARIAIPRWARPLIPGANELVRTELNIELNLGTVIEGAQWVARTGGDVIKTVEAALRAGQAELERLAANPPSLDLDELLALLPPEARAFECGLSFAGFEAFATIILATAADVTGPPPRPRRMPPATGSVRPGVAGTFVQPRFVGPALPATSGGVSLLQSRALRDFDAADLRALPALRDGVSSVLVVARVQVFGSSILLLGTLASDGRFALITKTDVRPLSLIIQGITIALPLTVEGRAVLRGQVTPTIRHAELFVRGHAEWDVIPGLIRVTAGQPGKPVELSVDSAGRFKLHGDGAVEVFGSTGLRIAGSIEASEAHLAVSGELRLALGGTTPVLLLEARGACSIGPGRRYSFEGLGSLRLFDLEMADVSVRLSQRDVAVHAQLARRRWRVGALQFDSHVSGEFDGRIRFPASGNPDLRLRGQGTVELLGARIDGALDIRAGAARTRLAAEGDLSWLGRRWFAARIAVDSQDGVDVSGRTSAVLDLTLDRLPTGIQLASLFLRADIDGRFGFGRGGALASHDFVLDWTLGVRLPGGSPDQAFVLAMQKLRIHGETTLNKELVHVRGLTFVPLGDIVLPIPKIELDGDVKLYSARIDMTVIDQVKFLMTEDMKNSLQAAFGVREVTTLFKVPKNLKITPGQATLNELAAAMNFRVRLRWKQGELGFEIRKGSARPFFPLAELF